TAVEVKMRGIVFLDSATCAKALRRFCEDASDDDRLCNCCAGQGASQLIWRTYVHSAQLGRHTFCTLLAVQVTASQATSKDRGLMTREGGGLCQQKLTRPMNSH